MHIVRAVSIFNLKYLSPASLLMKTDYMMPNDEPEKDRLDIMHEMFLTMMDRNLFSAPIGGSPGRVLDLGTGSGIWALDFGEFH